MSFKLRSTLAAWLCLLWVWPLAAAAQSYEAPFPQRAVLYQKASSDSFREIVERVVDPKTPVVADRDLAWSGTYFRLSDRRFAIDQAGELQNQAYLGGKPYVFLSVPEAAYGRSLYDVFADIGYGAEGLLREQGKRKVAFVFRYGPAITFVETRDGSLPAKVRSHVYVPTWDNAFALFAALAGEPPPAKPSSFLTLELSDQERALARFFPVEGLARIASLPYPLLRTVGGPDWAYRSLLENKMSMNAHFLGTGRTENTLSPADNRKGLPEFVGPNALIAELAEIAVIDFGRLAFVEVHD